MGGLAGLLEEAPFNEIPEILHFREQVISADGAARDKKWWSFTANSAFSVKSFYNFLNDGVSAALFLGGSGKATVRKKLISSIGWLGETKFSPWKTWKNGAVTGFRMLLV